MSDQSGAPERASINARLSRFADAEAFIEGYHPYFIRGGMLLKTRNPLPVGTPIVFQVRIAEDKVVMAGEGTIKQHRRDAEGNPVAAVIQFSRLNRASKDLYDRMMSARSSNPRLSGPHAAVSGASTGNTGKLRVVTGGPEEQAEEGDIGDVASELASSLDSLFDEIGAGHTGEFQAIDSAAPSIGGRGDRLTGDHTPPGGSTSTLFGIPRFAEGAEAAQMREDLDDRPETVAGMPSSMKKERASGDGGSPVEQPSSGDLSMDQALGMLSEDQPTATEAAVDADDEILSGFSRDTVPDIPLDPPSRTSSKDAPDTEEPKAPTASSQIDTARHDVSALLKSLTGEHEAVPGPDDEPDFSVIGAGHSEPAAPAASEEFDEDSLLDSVVSEVEAQAGTQQEEAEVEEPQKKGFWSRLFGG